MRLIQRVGDKWYIPNPVNPHNPGDPEDKGENFADRWGDDRHAAAKAFFQWVTWLREDLDGLLNSNDIRGMESTLKVAFGETVAANTLRHFDNRSTSGTVAGSIIQAGSMALAAFDVPHRQQPTWPVKVGYEVTIKGRATRKGWPTLMSQDGFTEIAKHYSLRFKAQTTTPWPYEVHWQVVNTGPDAARHGSRGLRGDIVIGFGTHEEYTLYEGFHWIQCFIIKNGNLVAKSAEFVVSIADAE